MKGYILNNSEWLGTGFFLLWASLWFGAIHYGNYSFIWAAQACIFLAGNIRFYPLITWSKGKARLVWIVAGLWFNFLVIDWTLNLSGFKTFIGW